MDPNETNERFIAFHKRVDKWIYFFIVFLPTLYCLYRWGYNPRVSGIFRGIGHLVLAVSLGVLYLFCGILLLTTLAQVAKTFQLFGLYPIKLRKRLSRLQDKTGVPGLYRPFSILIVLGAVMLMIIVLYTITGIDYVLHLTVFPFTVAVIASLYPMTAFPFVLFLSASRQDTITFLSRLSECLAPLAAVSLLDERAASKYVAKHASQFSFRTADHYAWEETVDELIEIAPIIALDTRYESPALVFEAERMLAPERAYKTFFIVGINNEHPLLDSVVPGVNLPGGCRARLVTEEQLLELIRYMKRSSNRLPKRRRNGSGH